MRFIWICFCKTCSHSTNSNNEIQLVPSSFHQYVSTSPLVTFCLFSVAGLLMWPRINPNKSSFNGLLHQYVSFSPLAFMYFSCLTHSQVIMALWQEKWGFVMQTVEDVTLCHYVVFHIFMDFAAWTLDATWPGEHQNLDNAAFRQNVNL